VSSSDTIFLLRTSARPFSLKMIATTALLALTTLGAANYAAAMDAVDQLETPRLVQGAQRMEFLQGDNTPFKFRFADEVSLPTSYLFSCLSRSQRMHGEEVVTNEWLLCRKCAA
jgi:hypothetical protein